MRGTSDLQTGFYRTFRTSTPSFLGYPLKFYRNLQPHAWIIPVIQEQTTHLNLCPLAVDDRRLTYSNGAVQIRVGVEIAEILLLKDPLFFPKRPPFVPFSQSRLLREVLGACAMPTKFLDNKICTLINFIVVAFPTKKKTFWTIFFSAPNAPPPQNHKCYFYCRLAVSEALREPFVS